MSDASIHKLADRLLSIRLAVADVRAADSASKMDAAWLEFLRSASRFYSTLSTASKVSGKAKAWFGRQKSIRRTDPLLSYIHQARNAEEHGLRHITVRDSTQVVLHPGSEVWLRSDGKQWHIENASGDYRPSHDVVALVTVTNEEYGDTFDPPTISQAGVLREMTPLEVANVASERFEALFVEARSVVTAARGSSRT